MQKPLHDTNSVRISGQLMHLQQRWTPDGTLAVTAELLTIRPRLGSRNKEAEQQPIPLRALGSAAEAMMHLQGHQVMIEGFLRRRSYKRRGEDCWGQVELWVLSCSPDKSQTQSEEIH